MLQLSSIMIGTDQLEVLAKFYSDVFQEKEAMKDENYHGWLVGSTFFSVGKHSEIRGKAKEPQRCMFNLETREVKEEFERIKKIEGATVIKEPYEMGDAWIATVADPDGNYFQLMSPWEEPAN